MLESTSDIVHLYVDIFPHFALYPRLGATQNIFKAEAQTSLLVIMELTLTFTTVLSFSKKWQKLLGFQFLFSSWCREILSFCCGCRFPSGYLYCFFLPPCAIHLLPDERVVLAGQGVADFCGISVGLNHVSFECDTM